MPECPQQVHLPVLSFSFQLTYPVATFVTFMVCLRVSQFHPGPPDYSFSFYSSSIVLQMGWRACWGSQSWLFLPTARYCLLAPALISCLSWFCWSLQGCCPLKAGRGPQCWGLEGPSSVFPDCETAPYSLLPSQGYTLPLPDTE